MRISTSIVAALVPIALLGAAACGNDDSDSDGEAAAEDQTTTTTTQAEEDHNQADVQFAQMMIPHHQGAVAMAELAPDRAEDPFILDIAERIQAAQDPEIQQMTGWLEEWGEDVPVEDAGGHDMGETTGGSDTTATSSSSSSSSSSADAAGGMPEGMMEDTDMAALEAASGAEFDRVFAEMMIEHHQGAIDMANDEIANGQHPEAIELAEAIAEAQEAEITELEGFLQQAP